MEVPGVRILLMDRGQLPGLLQPIPLLAARGCKEEGQLRPADRCVPDPASTDVQERMPGPEHPYGKTQR